MRKPPTPRADGLVDDDSAERYRSDPLRGHFIPATFQGGVLRTGSMDFPEGRRVEVGVSDTTGLSLHPGSKGRACGHRFATRSSMLRARRAARASAVLSSSEAMSKAVEHQIGGLERRFVSDVPYHPDFDLNGDGVIDAYEAFVMRLVDANGDGTLSIEERDKLEAIIDSGNMAALAFMQDRNGAGAKRALTWWNSSEESKRDRRRKESSDAARRKAAAQRASTEQHDAKGGMSAKLLEAMGMPVDALVRTKSHVGRRRAGDAEGPFTEDSSLGPGRRTMVGRQQPGLGYAEQPRFRSRAALLEWRRAERQPTSAAVDLSGSESGLTPEEALARHFYEQERRGTLRESDKAVADVIMSVAADTLEARELGQRRARVGPLNRRRAPDQNPPEKLGQAPHAPPRPPAHGPGQGGRSAQDAGIPPLVRRADAQSDGASLPLTDRRRSLASRGAPVSPVASARRGLRSPSAGSLPSARSERISSWESARTGPQARPGSAIVTPARQAASGSPHPSVSGRGSSRSERLATRSARFASRMSASRPGSAWSTPRAAIHFEAH